jgi:hypothetical protein
VNRRIERLGGWVVRQTGSHRRYAVTFLDLDLEGAHTYARTLPALDQAVCEVVVMALDRPDEDMPALLS